MIDYRSTSTSHFRLRKDSNGCQIVYNVTDNGDKQEVTMVGKCNWLDSKLTLLTFMFAAGFAVTAMLIIILGAVLFETTSSLF